MKSCITPQDDVSVCFTNLLGLSLNACSKVYVNSALLFCSKIGICCLSTVRNHEVLLDYVGTQQRGPYGDNLI